MTDREYIDAAVELANVKTIGTSDMTYMSVVGWETEPDPNDGKKAFIKLRWRALPEHLPYDARGTRFPAEIVVFTKLDNPTENNVKTYYLITHKDVKSKLKRKIGDIPLV